MAIMPRTLRALPPGWRLSNLLLLFSALVAVSQSQSIVNEGSGTTTPTEAPTTVAPADTNFLFSWGTENGDRHGSVAVSNQDIQFAFNIEPNLPLMMNNVPYTRLVVSSNGVILNQYWSTVFPGCSGFTNGQSPDGPSLVLAGLWSTYTQADVTASSLYARRTTSTDRNSAGYLRDFNTAVDNGLASSRDDIVWLLIATIFQENASKQNFVQMVLVALSDFTFKFAVEYKSVNLEDGMPLFVGYCQNNFIKRLILSDTLRRSTSPAAQSSFTKVLPNNLVQPAHYQRKTNFVKSANCLTWTSKEKRRRFFDVPACPCTLYQANNSPNTFGFIYNPTKRTVCASVFDTISGELWESVCCYRIRSSSLNVLTRSLSYSSQNVNDLAIRETCIEVGLFLNYLAVRPRPSCARYISPKAGAAFADPHFRTLDGVEYTCNAVGYYRFLLAGETVCDIKLEPIKQGSVITGISCKDVGSGIVTFDIDNNGKLNIRIKSGTTGSTVVTPDKFDEHGLYDTDGIFLVKDMNATESYFAKFEKKTIALSVVVVRVDGVIPILRQVLTVSKSVKVQTPSSSGLLGTFNGNINDDMRAPDGSMILITSTERQIYSEFCKLWEVDVPGHPTIYDQPAGSTRSRRSTRRTRAAAFSPSFCDEVTVDANLKALCKGNKQCECDGAITGSTAFAEATQVASSDIKSLSDSLDNSPPTAQGPTLIKATVGMEVTAQFTGEDPDNGTVTLTTTNIPAGAVFTGGMLTWTPTNIDKTETLSIKPTDNTGAVGEVLDVNLQVCDCKMHGNCLFDDLLAGSTTNDRYQVVKCDCASGWVGDHCSTDFNACCSSCGHSCLDTSSCKDLTPDEVKTLGRGFNCTACNTGYALQNDICADKDECTDPNVCQANAECGNTDGSYTCTCKKGYILNGAVCDDIDECADKTDNCDQICTDNDGAFTCTCHPGYQLNATSGICDQDAGDMSTCESFSCNLESTICVIQGGNTECVCKNGYEREAAKSCKPTNECTSTVSAHKCVGQATCVDQTPGYICTCPNGTVLSATKRSCDDCPAGTWGENCKGVCNCATNATCDPNTGCSQCDQGQMGASCELDLNECTATPQICGSNSTCNNTVGSYNCMCDPDYEKNLTTSFCQAINKCLNKPCIHGKCTQVEVSYKCDCEKGFSGERCDEDIDVCAQMKEACKNGGTCVEARGENFLCNCTDKFMGDTCTEPVTEVTTTTVAPPGEFSGRLKLSPGITIPEVNTAMYDIFKYNLTQALKDTIARRLNVTVAVEIDRITKDGEVFFTIIAPVGSKLVASNFTDAIIAAATEGKLETNSGVKFTVDPKSVVIGGPGPSDMPTTMILPALMGAVLGAAFLVLATILIVFIAKRCTRRAALRQATTGRPGYGPSLPGQLQWLPRSRVTGQMLANVRPRIRPPNMPWAVDPYEPEVDPSDVSWQQWRGGDNSYYNRSPMNRAMGPPLTPTRASQAPWSPSNMMFRNMAGRRPMVNGPPRQGLQRTRMSNFLQRTVRSIPQFLQRQFQRPFMQRPMPVHAPPPGLPDSAPGSRMPPFMSPEYGQPPPPMRMRMSGRAGMPGSGMGNGNFSTMPQTPAQFSWGARKY